MCLNSLTHSVTLYMTVSSSCNAQNTKALKTSNLLLLCFQASLRNRINSNILLIMSFLN